MTTTKKGGSALGLKVLLLRQPICEQTVSPFQGRNRISARASKRGNAKQEGNAEVGSWRDGGEEKAEVFSLLVALLGTVYEGI